MNFANKSSSPPNDTALTYQETILTKTVRKVNFIRAGGRSINPDKSRIVVWQLPCRKAPVYRIVPAH